MSKLAGCFFSGLTPQIGSVPLMFNDFCIRVPHIIILRHDLIQRLFVFRLYLVRLTFPVVV
jgi:hypothetical protein